jgi:hypothetical protein
MSSQPDQELLKARKLLNLYNMVPNVVWSVLNLVPVSVYCYNQVPHKLLYVFIAASVIPGFFPNSFFESIQVGRTTRIYKRMGVAFVNKFAQNGTIINHLVKKKFPNYKMIRHQRSSVNKLLQQTYMFEKFHFIMFVFFILITAYALIKNHFLWAIIISASNLVYNVYPNLLQQYVRVKLMLYKKLKAN